MKLSLGTSATALSSVVFLPSLGTTEGAAHLRDLKKNIFEVDSLTPDYLNGAGIPFDPFTVKSDHGVEVGLRARDKRCGASTNLVAGTTNTYQYQTCAAATARMEFPWNIDWQVNTDVECDCAVEDDCDTLAYFNFQLLLDHDPTYGENFVTDFDPVSYLLDNPTYVYKYDFDASQCITGRTPMRVISDHALGCTSTKQGGQGGPCGDASGNWGCSSNSYCNAAPDSTGGDGSPKNGCFRGNVVDGNGDPYQWTYKTAIESATVFTQSWQPQWFYPSNFPNLALYDKPGIFTVELCVFKSEKKSKKKKEVCATIYVLAGDLTSDFPQSEDDCKDDGWMNYKTDYFGEGDVQMFSDEKDCKDFVKNVLQA